ncbi:hypothetical protein Tco_0103146 [Tanacetum coccineum]
MAPRGRPTRLNPDATPTPVTNPTTTTSVTSAQLQAMIDQGVTAVLAAREYDPKCDEAIPRNCVRRHERAVRSAVSRLHEMSTLILKWHRRSVDLTQWIRGWNRICISNCTVENQVKFTNLYSYENCSNKKIEAELWNLKVKGIDVVAYNQRFQELALLYTGCQFFKKDCPHGRKEPGKCNADQVYAVGFAGQNPDNNVVTGTFSPKSTVVPFLLLNW